MSGVMVCLGIFEPDFHPFPTFWWPVGTVERPFPVKPYHYHFLDLLNLRPEGWVALVYQWSVNNYQYESCQQAVISKQIFTSVLLLSLLSASYLRHKMPAAYFPHTRATPGDTEIFIGHASESDHSSKTIVSDSLATTEQIGIRRRFSFSAVRSRNSTPRSWTSRVHW